MKKYRVTVNGTAYEVEVEEINGAAAAAAPAPAPVAAPVPAPAAAPAGGETVKAPMPGNILKVNFKEGQAVKKGEVLVILEAMKMENEILAPCDGTVKNVVAVGSMVETGSVICVIA